MKRKALPAIIKDFERNIIESGRGSNRAISMSNTRKITVKRKNRSEKGSRAEVLGSKPHSNGDFFSRSRSLRKEAEKETKRSTKAKVTAVRREIRVKSICLREVPSVG